MLQNSFFFIVASHYGKSWRKRTFERKRSSFISPSNSLQVLGSSFTTHASTKIEKTTDYQHHSSISSNQVVIDVEHCTSDDGVLTNEGSICTSNIENEEEINQSDSSEEEDALFNEKPDNDGYDFNHGFKLSERTSSITTPNKNLSLSEENESGLKHHNSLYIRKRQKAKETMKNFKSGEKTTTTNDHAHFETSSLRRVRFSNQVQTDENNKRKFTKTPEVRKKFRNR